MGDVVSTRLLTGWGRTSVTAARVVAPSDDAAVGAVLAHPPERGVLARGLGRAYGDAAQNAGGIVLDLTAAAAPPALDGGTGLVTAAGGTSFDELLRFLLPHGFFVPVTPGTRHVTIGGAVAADIHGKNHHRDGSWMDHVTAIELVLAGGEARTVGPDQDAAAFWATAGGMGLTGVVMACTFRALPVETSHMVVDTTRLGDLDAVMAAMADTDARHRYSVAWLDATAGRRALGRGIVTGADHAPRDAIDGEGSLTFDPRSRAGVPAVLPGGLLNAHAIRAVNEAWFRLAPRRRRGAVQTIASFFHPLDAVAGWNRLYGRRGFVQWQCVVPDDAADVLRVVLERLHRAGSASFLTVLKRFGPGNPGPLSFPQAGWTLALDLPAATGGLAGTLDGLDRLVADSGGRIYLAKDVRLAPELVAAMYPRLDEWRAVRHRLDPAAALQSDLGRRLGLVGVS